METNDREPKSPDEYQYDRFDDEKQRAARIQPLIYPKLTDISDVSISLCSFGFGNKPNPNLIETPNLGQHLTSAGLWGLKVSESNSDPAQSWSPEYALKYLEFFLRTIKCAAKRNGKEPSIVVCSEYAFPSFYGPSVPKACELNSIKAEIQALATEYNAVIFSGTGCICEQVPPDPWWLGSDHGYHVGFTFYPKGQSSEFSIAEEDYLAHHFKVYKTQPAEDGSHKPREGFSPGPDEISVYCLNRLSFGILICADFIKYRSGVDVLDYFDSMLFHCALNDISPGILFVPAKDNSGRVAKNSKKKSQHSHHYFAFVNSLDEISTIRESSGIFWDGANVEPNQTSIYVPKRDGSLNNRTSLYQSAIDAAEPAKEKNVFDSIANSGLFSCISHYSLDFSNIHNDRFHEEARNYLLQASAVKRTVVNDYP